jgi:hypothetical protein
MAVQRVRRAYGDTVAVFERWRKLAESSRSTVTFKRACFDDSSFHLRYIDGLRHFTERGQLRSQRVTELPAEARSKLDVLGASFTRVHLVFFLCQLFRLAFFGSLVFFES